MSYQHVANLRILHLHTQFMAIKTIIKNVLLVDDDKDDCSFFSEEFVKIDASIKITCINKARHLFLHAAELKPDIIFLDIDMPDLNGFQCLTELKKDRELGKIPVVMYSSSFHPKDIEKAYLYGAHLYLTKPSSLVEIRASIIGILELDWSSPEKITAAYFPNGKYKRFHVGL